MMNGMGDKFGNVQKTERLLRATMNRSTTLYAKQSENVSVFRLGFCTTLFVFQLSNFV